MLANAGYGDFAMTTIARKFNSGFHSGFSSGFSFFGHRGTTEADLTTLSDRSLKDIGFRLERRDLSSVKPFWLA
jgi:hypothetical protein